MNTSHYMDKQIMDLSNSQSHNDFIDLNNPHEDQIGGDGGTKKEDIMASYDFQPIRPVGLSQQPSNVVDSSNGSGTRVWTSADSKLSGIRNYGSLESTEHEKVILERDRNVIDAALVSEIDRTMKKHADNLLHAMEGVSARLSQLESRTRQIENSVDDLKVSVGNNYGSTDGKMRQLEIIIREVQTGVQVVRDKQEIVEAQLQLAKLQVSKAERQTEPPNTLHMDPVQPAASAPLQSHQQLPPVAHTQPPPTLSSPNAPPPPPQHILPPSVQLPNQFSQNQMPSVPQRDSYFPPPGQVPDATNQQYQLRQVQQPQPPPQPPQQQQQQYQPPPHPQYSQPSPPPQQHPSLPAVKAPQPLPQPPVGHHSEEMAYLTPQNYTPNMHQPPSHPPSGAPPSQQFYGTSSQMYEPPSSRPIPGFSAAYGSSPADQFTYGGSPSQYGSGSPVKSHQLSSLPMGQNGGSGYPQLPTARILPHALPTAAGVGGGSGSGSGSAGAGNRVPIDDVVDKVTNMGFSREQVKATVRKLTENGQSVDLNVVLDKLMNDGEGGQPPRGWFARQ